MIGIADISNVLKKNIAPAIQSQLFEENFLSDWLRKNSGVQKLNNNEFYITLIKQRNPSVAFQGSTITNLPTGTKDITSQAKVLAKYGFAVLRFDDRTIEALKSDAGALADEMETWGQQLKSDLAKDMNRQFFGYGTGKLTLVNDSGGGSGTTVVVDSTEYLTPGMSILIGTEAAVEITSVDSDTQITIAASRTWDDDDVITRADADGTAADEMMGLGGIVDAGTRVDTFQNIARSTNPWWKAYVDSTGEELAEMDMVTAYHKALKFSPTSKNAAQIVCITGQGLYEKYGRLLTADRMVSLETKEFWGGWKGLNFMGGKCPVYLDFDCPIGEMYFVNRDAITLAQLTPVGWMPGSNGVLTKVAGSTLWEAVLRFYGNLAAKSVAANSTLRAKTFAT